MELSARAIGNYCLVEEIGRGGVATVYRAIRRNNGHEVAVKVLFPILVSDRQMASRFDREIRVLRTLQHPNIVPIIDFGEENGFAYIVMPYYEDGTLQERLKTGPLKPKEGSRLIAQVTSALDYAHQQGIVHRDVKPSNILLDLEGNALLSDFGFAQVSDASVSLTGSALIGTPSYMSPEQCRGEAVDARSDLYSLGVILFQITTGQLPYEADTPMAVVIKQISEPLPSPRQVCPNLPESVEEVVIRSLEKDPAERFGSAAEMNNAFQAALKEAFSGKPRSTWRRKKSRVTRRPSASAAGAQRQHSRWSAVALGVLVGILTHFIAGPGLGALADVWEAQAGGPSSVVAEVHPDLGATVSALSTANAPLSGTETFPGEIATAVAATLAALSDPAGPASPTAAIVPPLPTPTPPADEQAPTSTATSPVEPTAPQGSNPQPTATNVPPPVPSTTPVLSLTPTNPPPTNPTATRTPTKTKTPASNASNTPTRTPYLSKTPTSTQTPWLSTKTQTPSATPVKSPVATTPLYPSPSPTLMITATSFPTSVPSPTDGVTPTDSSGSTFGDATSVPAPPSPTEPPPP